MDCLVGQFNKETGWNEDNELYNMCTTEKSLLDFKVPQGLQMSVASLSTPNFANTYQIANRSGVNGYISYLYTSKELQNALASKAAELEVFMPGYHHLLPLKDPRKNRSVNRASLFYSRMYLPAKTLEALSVFRLSRRNQLVVSSVSTPKPQEFGALTVRLMQDLGRWSLEEVYCTKGGLVGLRGLYNFNYGQISAQSPKKQLSMARLSAGGEIYYGVLNKTGGLSAAIRYSTVSANTSIPLQMALVTNPLSGHIAVSYAVKASKQMSFCSRMNFNIYSYESNLTIGTEIWRSQGIHVDANAPASDKPLKKPTNVVKLSADTASPSINCVWEGRYKDILFSTGASCRISDGLLKVGSIGVEFVYSR
ncbi:hypothetical protein CANCADRAFT_199 [Tortispora caseinolytica NRRL Y-17796]|uniref:Mitochondrial distribution and morphology protein 10 n=1 Tax=Tortispora caseinolytica NRRL Y-17796 TaxID=767744 RepID=A0A1E4TIP5_9ASCO|nr:hypothetical protein CANCADRAFT_199 [Tortispora caseinolytica NRRL Y-17796]